MNTPRSQDQMTFDFQQSLHDQIISRLYHPTWLVGGELLGNSWIIETDDSSQHRNTKHPINYDIPILPGHNLSDKSYEYDRIMAKLYVYWSFDQFVGWSRTAITTYYSFKALITFIRWKATTGISRLSELTPAWFELFHDTIANEGAVGLLKMEDRVDIYLNQLDTGKIIVPLTRHGQETYVSVSKLAEQLGADSWQQFPADTYWGLMESLKSRGYAVRAERISFDHHSKTKLTVSRIYPLLGVWDKLWLLRDKMPHDAIDFTPFTNGTTPMSMAEVVAQRDLKRTPTIPAYQACFLMDRAIRWVLIYSKELIAYAELVESIYGELRKENRSDIRTRVFELAEQRFKATPGREDWVGSPWPLHWHYSASAAKLRKRDITPNTSLRTALLEHLPTACAIVIAAFSARRKEEIASLKDTSLLVEDGEASLDSWIEKTIRDTRKVPVPRSVQRAIEILDILSKSARVETGKGWLFQFKHLLSDGREGEFIIGHDFNTKLRAFAAFVEVPPVSSGERWHFTPHQFRRFFGIVYYHRFRYPNLTALSAFYYHFDPDVTRDYVTNAATGGLISLSEEMKTEDKAVKRRRAELARQRLEDFNTEGQNFRIDRYRAAAKGDEPITGFGGDEITRELKALVEQAKRSVSVESEGEGWETTLDQLLVEFARDRRLEPNKLGHSYCKCTSHPQDLRVAACLTLKRADEKEAYTEPNGPDHTYASDLVCSGCPQNVQLPENKSYWQDRLKAEEGHLACGFGPLLSELAGGRRDAIKKHLDRCFPADEPAGPAGT